MGMAKKKKKGSSAPGYTRPGFWTQKRVGLMGLTLAGAAIYVAGLFAAQGYLVASRIIEALGLSLFALFGSAFLWTLPQLQRPKPKAWSAIALCVVCIVMAYVTFPRSAAPPSPRPITDLRFGINTHWVNLGPLIAHDVVSSSDVGFAKPPISPDRENIEYGMFRNADARTENDPKDFGINQGIVLPVNTSLLTDQQLSDIESRPPRRVVYVFGHIRFRDPNGTHDVELCMWLQMPLESTGIWHPCFGHNRVTGNPATNVQFDAVVVRPEP